MPIDLDQVNQSRWSAPRVVAEFDRTGSVAALECWTDAGERAAVLSVASAVRGGRILDLGVGGGRTTGLLRLLSNDYIGVDYLPEMVAVCQRNHPGVDIRLGDARQLTEVDDGSCRLVVFSNNGLDAISHEDRQLALSEISRTLVPGGLALISTHNKSGPCYGASPWRPAGSPNAHSWSTLYKIARTMLNVARSPVQLPRAVLNWRRLRAEAVDGGGWGIGPVEAHAFGLLIHYTTLAGAAHDLSAVGLSLLRAYDAEHGQLLDTDVEPSGARYFHLIAQKSS